MDKEIELRIQNLIQLRTNLYTALIVLVGGICGVILTVFNDTNSYTIFFKIIFLAAGIFLMWLILSSLKKMSAELNKYLYSKEK